MGPKLGTRKPTYLFGLALGPLYASALSLAPAGRQKRPISKTPTQSARHSVTVPGDFEFQPAHRTRDVSSSRRLFTVLFGIDEFAGGGS